MIASSSPAFAQQHSSLTEAQQQELVRLIETGKSAYDEGQFDRALTNFRHAYDIYRHADIVYRIALCYERLGEDVEAVRYYRQFLAEAPTAPERPRIEKTIEVIEARIAKSEIRVTTMPAKARVYINDVANGVAGETPTTLPVAPGNYTIIVHKDGYHPIEQLVSVASGKSLQLHYQLSSLPQPAEAPPKTARPSPITGPVVALGAIAVASGITSVVFFKSYKKRADDLMLIVDRQGLNRDVFNRMRRDRDIHLGVAIGTATLAVGSVVAAYWIITSNSTRTFTATAGWNDGPYTAATFRF